jgi:hypothetical protein
MVAADLYLQKYPNFSHIFVYLIFLQNQLALIVGTVGCECKGVLAAPLESIKDLYLRLMKSKNS